MASINDLDNPLLVLILNRLCIQKLFTAGHVCVRWNAIRAISANSRKELTLLVGQDAQQYIDEALFRVPERRKLVAENGDALITVKSDAPFQVESLSVDLGKFLYNNLPNLSTLTISYHNMDHLDSVTYLLKQFSSTGQLHTLKLFTDSVDQPLLSALNSMGTLKKLQLNFTDQPQWNRKPLNRFCLANLDLPILGQLEEFDFYAPEFIRLESLKNSIVRYGGQNPELRSIRIDNCIFDFIWTNSIPRDLASRFHHLHMYMDPIRWEHSFTLSPVVRSLDEMCRHFHNLTSLQLSKYLGGHEASTPTQLFTSLSHLHNLLSLTIDTTVMESIPSVHKAVNKNIPTLPSVRVLTIKIKHNFKSIFDLSFSLPFLERTDHEDFSNRNVHHYFPNVETVRLTRRAEECVDCRSKCNSKFAGFSKLPILYSLMFCTLRLVHNFTKCQQLKRVCAKIGDSYVEFTVKEIKDFAENERDYFTKKINEFLNSSKNKDMLDFEIVKNRYSSFLKSSLAFGNTNPNSIQSNPLPCLSVSMSMEQFIASLDKPYLNSTKFNDNP